MLMSHVLSGSPLNISHMLDTHQGLLVLTLQDTSFPCHGLQIEIQKLAKIQDARHRILCTLKLVNVAGQSAIEECVCVIKTQLHDRRGSHGVSECPSALVWK